MQIPASLERLVEEFSRFPDIILQLLFCEHLPHFCFAAGIPDHCSSSTHQGDHPLPVPLQVGQSHQRDEVSDME